MLAIAAFFLMALGFNEAQAQDKYGYATFSNQFDAGNDNAYYLVISDPVKNWFKLSKEEQQEWKTEFRIQANRKAGFKLMNNYQEPVPYRGAYEAFDSKAACKEKAQDEAEKFKKNYSGYEKPVKIIYVELYKH